MSKGGGSILGNIWKGLVGDVFIFGTALLLMSAFAFTSISNAYLIVLSVVAVIVVAFVVHRRSGNKARETIAACGGSVMEGEWSNPVFKICNVKDPEGNHIQIREFKS
ncbi:hypothetical protein [Pseudohongiella sp. O18]|uniref:hypothetical protein n=1 Tax=Pseudohongiella sp. O18 TaxID=2904248 RepID=UPI001F393D23|nr:hypothetical protein [Pseudohongiella sp. O18]